MKKTAIFTLFLLFSNYIYSNSSRIIHQYFCATYNHYAGNITSAQNWYQSIFSTNYSLYTYKGYIPFLFETKQYSNIIGLIPSLDKKFENDPEIQLIFALSLEKNNQISQADSRLIKISSLFKNHSEITLRTAQTYIRRKEPENALITIDTFLNNSPRKPNNFIFYFLKSQIQLQLNKLPDALHSITICLDMHPRSDKGWLMVATLNEQQGEIEKAIAGYSTFLELSKNNKNIEEHLQSLIITHKKRSLPHQTTRFYKTDLDQALLKIKLLAEQNKYDELTQYASAWQMKNKDNSPIVPETIYLLSYANGNTDKIAIVLKNLSSLHPENIWFPLYASDLCIRSKQINSAIDLLNQAAKKSNNTCLKATIYYQLALLEYEEKQYDQMILLLEKAHELDNSIGHVNNARAYYWATKGKNLVKAQQILDQLSPEERKSHYALDTQAIILYKQHKHQDARYILEQISTTDNATILLHLAKIHYALDNKKKAQYYTKRAEFYINSNHHQKSIKKMHHLLAAND